MNKVLLIGNLARDPESRQTGSGLSVCNFTVAVNRRKGKDGTQECDFINCTAYGVTGENIAKYLKKGRKVGVSGRMQCRSYEAQDGSKRYVTEVIADETEFLDRAAAADAGESKAGAAQMMEIDEGELPF